jgi:glycine betaine/proline transport system substrate-binding protein
MKKILMSIGCIAIAACLLSTTAWAAGKPITIALNDWAENIAVAHLWKQLLDQRGYQVKLQTAQEGITWMGIARGQMQMNMDIWLPTTDAPYYHRYKNQVNLIGPWFVPARLGLVVPQYSPVNSIPELRQHANEFKVHGSPAIVGIAPGTSEMPMTHRAIKAYHLPMKLINSSEAAMMAALKRAYDKHKNIVVTLWSPHWAWAVYKLKYLSDPKKIYGNGDHLYIITEKDFASKYPKIQRWIKRFHMSTKQLASLEADIKKTNTTQGVKSWMKNHKKLIHSWFQPQ